MLACHPYSSSNLTIRIIREKTVYQLKLSVDMLYNELYCHLVVSSAWHNDIRMHHERRDIIIKSWLHVFTVLFQYAIQISAPLRDVPPQAPGKSDVSVGIDKNFHVAHLLKTCSHCYFNTLSLCANFRFNFSGLYLPSIRQDCRR